MRCILTAIVLALAAAPAAAEPALWAVRDADSTIYLFGTVHALRPALAWRSAKIDRALKAATEIWLEVADADDPAAAQPLIAKYGMDAAHPLSARLSPADIARLDTAAKAIGLPGAAALDAMRPWVAAIIVSMGPLMKAGYATDAGVDRVVKGAAQTQGDAIRAFETLEQQFRFLADLSPAAELQFLGAALDDNEAMTGRIDALVRAWAAGDVAAIDHLNSAELRDRYPQLYDILVVQRNAAWARAIKARLAGSGISFVAVGAAHLAGPDSLQAALARLGVKATRL